MTLDLRRLLEAEAGRTFDLFAEHVNPQYARVLRTIGFDRDYVRAEGAYLWDRDGHRYLDMLGGYAVCNAGRNHPAVRLALEQCLELGIPGWIQFEAPPLAGILARELKRRIGRGLDHVFFTNSGAEGIEAALKFARAATGRPGFVHAASGFHGLTTGALALNGCPAFRDGFGPLLEPSRTVPFDDLEALERALAPRDIAAFVVEPIQGKGVHLPSPGYLEEAGRICRRHGTLFVVDEVQTGLGRTGSFLAIDQEGAVDPDMIVLSKALSGGFVPVGAVLVRGEIWRRTFSGMDRAIVHSSTFHMGALAMTAGLAMLEVLDEERLAANAERIGNRIGEGLRALAPRFEYIDEVRQRGLMIAVEFRRPRALGLRTGWDLVHAMDRNLFAQAVTMPLLADERILCQVAGHDQDTVKFTPPLTVNDSDASWLLDGFERVMERLHRFPGPAFDVLRRLGRHALGASRRPAPESAVRALEA